MVVSKIRLNILEIKCYDWPYLQSLEKFTASLMTDKLALVLSIKSYP